MFKVLKIDGPNLVTDRGCICLLPSQYADGGKTQPVGNDAFKAMRALFVAAPDLFSSLMEMVAELLAHATLGLNEEEVAMLKRAEAAIAKVNRLIKAEGRHPSPE